MSVTATLREGIAPLVDLVYPPRCPLCGTSIGAQTGLCAGCWSELRIPGEPACTLCQRPFGDAHVGEGAICAPCLADPPRHDGIAAGTLYGDGSQTRSFCYVSDLVEGIYRLLWSDYHLPVNIGNPVEITLKEFAEEVVALTGSKSKIIYKPLPTDDPKQRQPDITRAKTLLGWQPKVNRADGVRITYEYFKSLPHEELFKQPKEFKSLHK